MLLNLGIQYEHYKGLGRLRHARADSLNTAWRVPSFRGYAYYMQTDEFKMNLEELIANAKQKKTTLYVPKAFGGIVIAP